MSVEIKRSKKNISAVFTRVKNKLALVLADSPQIHHVGSTAVLGLDGKNILDILISAKDSEHMNELRDKLIAIGYFPSLNPSSRQGISSWRPDKKKLARAIFIFTCGREY